MFSWFIILVLAICFGITLGFVRTRWVWLWILPAPMLVIYALNYYYDRLPPTAPGASMSALAYIFAGIPAISIALITYHLIRYYRSDPR